MKVAAETSLADLLPRELIDRLTVSGDLDARLRESYVAGQQNYPSIGLTAVEYIGYLVPRLGSVGRIEELALADLFLCAACAKGEHGAISAFEQTHFPPLTQSLRSHGVTEEDIQEVLQHLRTMLFVRAESGRTKLTEYSGRAKLISWLRVVAMNTLHNRRRSDVRRRSRTERSASSLVDAIPDLEISILKTWQRSQIERIIERSIRSLSVENRRLLRFHFVDLLSIDKLALLHGVHRATIARRIVRAMGELRDKVQRALMDELDLDVHEYESLLRFVRSQIELSLSTWL